MLSMDNDTIDPDYEPLPDGTPRVPTSKARSMTILPSAAGTAPRSGAAAPTTPTAAAAPSAAANSLLSPPQPRARTSTAAVPRGAPSPLAKSASSSKLAVTPSQRLAVNVDAPGSASAGPASPAPASTTPTSGAAGKEAPAEIPEEYEIKKIHFCYDQATIISAFERKDATGGVFSVESVRFSCSCPCSCVGSHHHSRHDGQVCLGFPANGAAACLSGGCRPRCGACCLRTLILILLLLCDCSARIASCATSRRRQRSWSCAKSSRRRKRRPTLLATCARRSISKTLRTTRSGRRPTGARAQTETRRRRTKRRAKCRLRRPSR